MVWRNVQVFWTLALTLTTPSVASTTNRSFGVAATGPGPHLPLSRSPQQPVLMNNTRLSYPNSLVLPTFVTNGSLDGMRGCLQFCIESHTCGGMVWMAPYEPIPVPRPGCAKQRRGVDGCCYPAPVLDHYVVVNCTPSGDKAPCTTPATYGFVSAIVRTNASRPWPTPSPPPPPPPPWIPSGWAPNWEMNKSIAVYWRNSTGIEPAGVFLIPF